MPIDFNNPATLQLFSQSNVLRTNDPPLEPEQDTLRGLVADTQRNILACDTEINELERKILRTQSDRRKAVVLLDISKGILSPIRRLPREIIAEIVLQALQMDSADKWAVVVTLDTRIGPWKYAQICRIWRDAILSFPQLWTHFRFDTHSTPPSMKPSMYEHLMRTLIHRSQRLPVSFVFDEQALHESAGLLRILLGESHRWKHAQLTIDNGPSFTGLNAARGKVPILERLTLYARFGLLHPRYDDLTLSERAGSLVMHGFAYAPLLRTLSVNLPFPVDVSFPMAQLTMYEERDYPLTLYPYRLSDFTNLVECRLSNQNSQDKLIEFPKLRRLRVLEPDILEYLVVPNLECLYVEHGCAHPANLDPLIAMLRRSHCALRSFVINGQVEILELIHLILPLMPLLVALRILNTAYEKDIFASLIASGPHAILVPKLEVLTIAFINAPWDVNEVMEIEGPAGTITRMIDSRWNIAANPDGQDSIPQVARLKQFFFTVKWREGRRFFQTSLIQHLREMVQTGRFRALLEFRDRNTARNIGFVLDEQRWRIPV